MAKRILVIEDEPDMANLFHSFLGLSGYETHVSNDGRDAVYKARDLRPDLILLDLMLPKLNGLDVCKILRSDPVTKTTPILVMTALDHMGDVDKAFAAGANDYLAKPFETDRLVQKVKKLLGELKIG